MVLLELYGARVMHGSGLPQILGWPFEIKHPQEHHQVIETPDKQNKAQPLRPMDSLLSHSRTFAAKWDSRAVQWLESREISVIYCYSRLLLPRPADWGPNAFVVGPMQPPEFRPATFGLANGQSRSHIVHLSLTYKGALARPVCSANVFRVFGCKGVSDETPGTLNVNGGIV